ncbi:MAG: guanylate kinase [Alphaproteobacteria bacterium]|nr:guanylate kinase [Alphaproteobacteria bacterium]
MKPARPVATRGLMLVLSSPSGAGKSTISRAVLEREENIALLVSLTTRPPRKGEEDGRDYIFVDDAAFQAMVERDGFLEHAEVFGHRYGTPRAPVEAALEKGRDMLFDIDWQGAQQIAEKARTDLVGVFVLPPSIEELERRLHARAQDSSEVVRARMAKALDEVSHYAEYDYVVINSDLETSIEEVRSILRAERRRRTRQTGLTDFVNALRGERR